MPVAVVPAHPRRGTRGVRRHLRRVHVRLVGPFEKLYPWGTLYECADCNAPVIRDERAIRRWGRLR